MLDKKVAIGKSGSIRRFKSVFQDVPEMDLGKDRDWQFICDCEKIRDCLLHANGRIDLLRNSVEIEKIIACSNGLLKVHVKSVEITGKFLKEFTNVVRSFIAKVGSEEKL